MKVKDEIKYDVNNGEQWYCSIIFIHKKENGMIICPWKKFTRLWPQLFFVMVDMIWSELTQRLPWKCLCGVVFSAIS